MPASSERTSSTLFSSNGRSNGAARCAVRDKNASAEALGLPFETQQSIRCSSSRTELKGMLSSALTDRIRDIIGGSAVAIKTGVVEYRGRYVCVRYRRQCRLARRQSQEGVQRNAFAAQEERRIPCCMRAPTHRDDIKGRPKPSSLRSYHADAPALADDSVRGPAA